LLTEYSRQSGVGILAYCLMPNHIHLIAVPEEEDSLSICLRRTHGRYAQYHNARRVRSGHLWQNPFYSCAMEECHLWNAIRDVELNPVRAGLVESPERFRWSSAAAHLSGSDSSHLLDMAFWQQSGGAQNWQELLNTTATEGDTKRLRSATYSGKPLGSEGFVKQAMAALATKMEEPITRFHPARASRFSEQEYTEVLASGG
jgi:putative transposase